MTYISLELMHVVDNSVVWQINIRVIWYLLRPIKLLKVEPQRYLALRTRYGAYTLWPWVPSNWLDFFFLFSASFRCRVLAIPSRVWEIPSVIKH